MSLFNLIKKLLSLLSAFFAFVFFLGLIAFYGPHLMEGLGDNFSSIAFLIAMLAIYLIPSSTAIGRDHKDKKAIIALNVLLGWTAFGWIASLVWSYTGVNNRKRKEAEEINSKKMQVLC